MTARRNTQAGTPESNQPNGGEDGQTDRNHRCHRSRHAAFVLNRGVVGRARGAPLVSQARQVRDRYAERGTWSNPIAAATSDEDGAKSADTVMAATLAGYSRVLVDRGGWLNPYVDTRTYDAGHPLLASAPGDGATTTR